MARRVVLPKRVRVRIRQLRRQTRAARVWTRCQIILLADKGRSPGAIAEAVGCSRSWAGRIIRRFKEHGEATLLDGRQDNGMQKVDEEYLARLWEVVGRRPSDYGWRRPTWTRELLIDVMQRQTGVRIDPGTMSRALHRIRARRGRPRPVVNCPWSPMQRAQRLRQIERVVARASPDEPVVYGDEVDIHLNPKIGLDWMNRGQQKEVVTPGCNEKRYLAGALDARTRQLTCVEGTQKNSMLFVGLLWALRQAYPRALRIHLILDNCRIHHSRIVKVAMKAHAGRLVLHFLPPYSPNENRIERLWQDLHGEVTRNHCCSTMEELMQRVREFLREHNLGVAMTSERKAA